LTIEKSYTKEQQEMKSLDEIQTLIPDISFHKLFKGIAPPGFSIDGKQIVQVEDMDYFQSLSSIIGSISKGILHDYFQWRLIETWSIRLHESYIAPIRLLKLDFPLD
jgi:Peptidase family M13